MKLDPKVMKLLAHLDQTRADLREVLREMPSEDVAAIVRTAAAGKFDEFDERVRLLVGLLAVVAIFDLRESTPEGV